MRLLRIDILRGAALHGGAGCLLAIALMTSGCDRPTESSVAASPVASAAESTSASSRQLPEAFPDIVSTPTRGIVMDADASEPTNAGVLRAEFLGEAFDLGSIQQGERVRRILVLKNRSATEPLSISTTSTSCGCVRVILPSGDTVLPGGELPVELDVHAVGSSPSIEQTVDLAYSVDGRPHVLRIKVVGSTYPPPLSVIPQRVLVRAAQDATTQHPLRIFARSSAAVVAKLPAVIELADGECTQVVVRMSRGELKKSSSTRMVMKEIELKMSARERADSIKHEIVFVDGDDQFLCSVEVLLK